MFAHPSVSHILPKERRASGNGHPARIASRILIVIALAAALFGKVGIEVCLSHPLWEKHLWLPTMLIVLAMGICLSTLFHSITFRLFGK